MSVSSAVNIQVNFFIQTMHKMPIPTVWLMRLTDDILTELHDAYLSHADGMCLALTCRCLNRLLCYRSLSCDTWDGWVVADELAVRRLAVRATANGGCPVLCRYSALRCFQWTARCESHATITAVLCAAADLLLLEDLKVCLEYCGLTDASADGVVGQPIRAVRRAARRLRCLTIELRDDPMGEIAIGCVVAAAASSPVDAGSDRDQAPTATTHPF